MVFISDADVRSVLTFPDAIAAMADAFRDHGRGGGAMQDRVRVYGGGVSLSMMGAILTDAGVTGAKVYPTVDGKFNFILPLFSNTDGRLIAVMEGNALTEFRTAAVTVVAANALARRDAEVLAVFGTGIQARAHLEAFLTTRSFGFVHIVGREGAVDCARWVRDRFGVDAAAVEAAEALREADIIVTATRAKTPLFSGNAVKRGAFVAAIGSSKPDTREIDAILLERAERIVVEWKPQARREAGDLVLAGDVVDWERVEELGAVVAEPNAWRGDHEQIIVFKSVGVGIEDVALANLVARRLCIRT
ncbi:ornithine cyclodeaminase family protein (plasmid) [Azospirillum oryzae]|uniref:Ornithine cyclodeaminase family protein n=1 Tax=Azospirillum oryzae TaxID=286727 RepID=A0A6N1AGK0_9PROT|nr:ornithine cyclodeaminase family protein [Azospirillum oryzae]QKS50676.1 ornithine cyclodeaminase family protein [Azospirillum oryzae]